MCNGHQTLALFSNWILCDGSLEDSLLIWDETVEILLSTIIYTLIYIHNIQTHIMGDTTSIILIECTLIVGTSIEKLIIKAVIRVPWLHGLKHN